LSKRKVRVEITGRLRRLWPREVSALEQQREIHQGNHHRHFDQRADHSGEHSAGVDAEHGDRNGDGQLEVV
jgi:hypothetical protein